MNGSKTLKTAALLVVPALLLSSSFAAADSVKTISRSIDVSSLDAVEIEASVAEMEIEVYDGNEIQLEIELESERSWLAWRRGSVDDVELETHESESSLYLGITNKRVQQHWQIKLPAKLALALEIGVGDIQIEDFANNLEMKVGVGSVRVEIDDTDYALIHATAGVGDASIRGFRNHADNERNFVSADSYYHGDGVLEMTIEVGVGDVDVRSM